MHDTVARVWQGRVAESRAGSMVPNSLPSINLVEWLQIPVIFAVSHLVDPEGEVSARISGGVVAVSE